MNLANIIETECIPQRNCLLTIASQNGEVGFLYFKDAQLVESNQGSIWGEEALAQVAHWKLAHYSLADCPVGIKRSLWEPWDKLLAKSLEPEAGASPAPVQQQAPAVSQAEAHPAIAQSLDPDLRQRFENLQTVYGFLGALLEENDEVLSLATSGEAQFPAKEWYLDFREKCSVLGRNLGAGLFHDYYIHTGAYHLWRHPVKGKTNTYAIVLAAPSTDAELMEATLIQSFSAP